MATSNDDNTISVSLKLLIDTKGGKVLFAEASKEVVDFLFTLLSLPIGTVISLLTKNGMVGCLGKLYESVEELNDTYLQSNLKKDSLLKPKATGAGADILRLTYDNSQATGPFYLCASSRCRQYVSDVSTILCPACGNYHMSSEVTYVSPFPATGVVLSSEGGYVKGVVTYMVMDNLEVKPMSTISSITVLNKFNVKEVGALEEKVVNLGMEEGLKLLKASLECNAVLTKVFLNNKSA